MVQHSLELAHGIHVRSRPRDWFSQARSFENVLYEILKRPDYRKMDWIKPVAQAIAVIITQDHQALRSNDSGDFPKRILGIVEPWNNTHGNYAISGIVKKWQVMHVTKARSDPLL